MAEIIREIGLEDAKDELASLVDAAIRNEPSIITRHGKPVAVILSYGEWQRLNQVPGC